MQGSCCKEGMNSGVKERKRRKMTNKRDNIHTSWALKVEAFNLFRKNVQGRVGSGWKGIQEQGA